MRSAGNFSPEWGYLAPAPSFMRTARMVVVATAIGATAGAAVVLTLIERPATEPSPAAVAARAIVTSVQAATPPAAQRAVTTAVQAAPVAPAQAASAVSAAPVNASTATNLPAGQPVSVSVAPGVMPAGQAAAAPIVPASPQEPPSVTASTEQPAPAEAVPAIAPDDTAALPAEPTPPKKQAPPHRGGYATNDRAKPTPTIGTVLQHLFTAHAGNSYYPNR